MRNLLSLLGALGLTVTATTTVIACGNKKNHVIQKTALRDLHLKTHLSSPITDPEEAFESFIELNAEVSDLHDSVSIDVFFAPDYNREGTLQVQAIPNTNYSGTLTIIIPSLIKTDIASLVRIKTISGVENMTAGGGRFKLS